MAMGQYQGVSGVARKVTKRYEGVSGVAQNVTKAYTGVSGVARQYFTAEKYFNPRADNSLAETDTYRVGDTALGDPRTVATGYEFTSADGFVATGEKSVSIGDVIDGWYKVMPTVVYEYTGTSGETINGKFVAWYILQSVMVCDETTN